MMDKARQLKIALDATGFKNPGADTGLMRNFFDRLISSDSPNQYFLLDLYNDVSFENLLEKLPNYHEKHIYLGQSQEFLGCADFEPVLESVIKRFLYENKIDVFIFTGTLKSEVFHYPKNCFDGVKTVSLTNDQWMSGEANGNEFRHLMETYVIGDQYLVKKRIAMFAPLPPKHSGIADYSKDIIEELGRYTDIDVYIDEGYEVSCDLPDNVQAFPHTEFKKNADKYSEIVYQFGNSWLYHGYMVDYMEQYPGIVVLHDGNLHSMVHALCVVVEKNYSRFAKLLSYDYDKDEIKSYIKLLSRDKIMPDFHKTWVNGFAVNIAKKIIVHNRYLEKKLLNRNLGFDISIIPLYAKRWESTASASGIRTQLGFGSQDIIIGVFGFVACTKKIQEILQAFEKLEHKNHHYRLVVVGGYNSDDAYAASCIRYIKQHNLQDKAFLTGYVESDIMEQYISICDICLNLRYEYKGESSASLAHILIQGKCVVVNDIGVFAEIPDAACIKVPYREVHTEDEVDELVGVIDRLQDDRLRSRIGNNAREYALKRLDLMAVAEAYYKCICRPNYLSITSESIERLLERQAFQNYSGRDLNLLADTIAYSKGY